jgi:hypothetical protein
LDGRNQLDPTIYTNLCCTPHDAPTPPGVKPPIGLDIKKDAFPARFNSLHFPALKVWYKGLKYLYQYNRMQLLLTHPQLFNSVDIDPASAFTTMIRNPLVNSPWISAMPLLEDVEPQQYNSVLVVLRNTWPLCVLLRMLPFSVTHPAQTQVLLVPIAWQVAWPLAQLQEAANHVLAWRATRAWPCHLQTCR